MLPAAILVAVGCFAFWPGVHGTWLWDDDLEITENVALRDVAGLGRIWLSPTTADYLPLKSTVQWIGWHLWRDHAFGYHLLNLALHITSAFLLWRLLHALRVAWTANRPMIDRQRTDAPEWLAGLLFVVHPVAVESVAWISELKNTLSLPFLLLSLLGYIRFDLRCRRADYLHCLIWFVAALLCKSSVIMLPVMVLLYSWWRHGRIAMKHLRASAPLFGVALLFGLVTLWLQSHRALAGESLDENGWSRMAGAGQAIGFYFSKCILPIGLVPVYPRWNLHVPALWQFWPWLLLASGFAWLWTKRAGWGRHLLFGLGCFGANLAPVLGFAPMSYLKISWVADHFAYLSLASLAVLAAAWLCEWHRWIANGPEAKMGRRIAVFHFYLAALATALALMTCHYSNVFLNQETLWRYTVQRNPGSWVAHGNLANAMVAAERSEEAIAHYRTAVQIKPDYFDGQYNLAGVLLKAGMPEAAAEPGAKAAQLRPDDPAARFNFGLTLLFLDRFAEAASEFEAVAKLRPESPEAHYFVGHALLRGGRAQEAVAHYKTALRLRPDYADAQAELARIASGL